MKSKGIFNIAKDPGVLFPLAFATLTTAGGGPLMATSIGVSVGMIALKLHQDNQLGALSEWINKKTRHTGFEKFMKNPTAVLQTFGGTLMGIGLVGGAGAAAGLGEWFYGSPSAFDQGMVAVSTLLLGYSQFKKSKELQNTQTGRQSLLQKLARSETAIAGVAVCSHILALGAAAAFTAPIAAASLAVSMTGNNDPAAPRWALAERFNLSDTALSRYFMFAAGAVAGGAALATGNYWLGVSNLFASAANWQLFKMTRQHDQELRETDNAGQAKEAPAAPPLKSRRPEV